MDERGWPVCRTCGVEQLAVDERGHCGACRAKLRARTRRMRRWAEVRRIKGLDVEVDDGR